MTNRPSGCPSTTTLRSVTPRELLILVAAVFYILLWTVCLVLALDNMRDACPDSYRRQCATTFVEGGAKP